MNLPNKLTISRIILTFVFMFLLFSHGLIFKVLAFFVFLMAVITDYLDGKIARERNLVTNLGKLLDPIADKLLTLGALLAFVEMKLIPAWMVVIIIGRELIITGIRAFAASFNKIIPASNSGKHKTISQMVTILIILLFLILKELGEKFGFWNNSLEKGFDIFIYFMMLFTTLITAVSGILILIKNKGIFLNEKD